METSINKEKRYPQVFERVKASFIDGLVMIGFATLFSIIFSKFETVDDSVRVFFFGLVLLYDPIFTNLFGGTIGHYMNNIRVKNSKNEEKNISIFNAILRYVVKILLGWISLLTISSQSKSQALHDLAANSVVKYSKNK